MFIAQVKFRMHLWKCEEWNLHFSSTAFLAIAMRKIFQVDFFFLRYLNFPPPQKFTTCFEKKNIDWLLSRFATFSSLSWEFFMFSIYLFSLSSLFLYCERDHLLIYLHYLHIAKKKIRKEQKVKRETLPKIKNSSIKCEATLLMILFI